MSTTLDDSIGDAFDKVSRALQLPWQAQGMCIVDQGRGRDAVGLTYLETAWRGGMQVALVQLWRRWRRTAVRTATACRSPCAT